MQTASDCIDEDKLNSTTIISSKSNIPKMQAVFWPHCRINDCIKLIVYGFIHYNPIWKKAQNILSKYYVNINNIPDFYDNIPSDVMNLCCIFYDCSLDLPTVCITPFTILFVLFDLQSPLTVKGWQILDNDKQCEYLKYSKVYTDPQCEEVMNHFSGNDYNFSDISPIIISRLHDDMMTMLVTYNESNYEDVNEWSGVDLIRSFIRYLVNDTTDSMRKDPNTWQFVEYFRRFCRDTGYNGSEFHHQYQTKDETDCKYTSILNKVCKKYNLESYSSDSPIGIAINEWMDDVEPISLENIIIGFRHSYGGYQRIMRQYRAGTYHFEESVQAHYQSSISKPHGPKPKRPKRPKRPKPIYGRNSKNILLRHLDQKAKKS